MRIITPYAPYRGTLERAWRNIRLLRRAVAPVGLGIARDKEGDGDGLYGFWVFTKKNPKRRVSVVAPGARLDDPSILCEPRYYVNGDSWTLKYAPPFVREALRL